MLMATHFVGHNFLRDVISEILDFENAMMSE